MSCAFVDLYELHLDLCNWSFMSGLSCMAKILTLDITHKLFNQFLHTCHAYRHDWFLPVYVARSDLDFGKGRGGGGVQGQHKAKPVGVIFFCIFQLNGMNYGIVMEQFMLNILRLLLSEICDIYRIKRSDCCLLHAFKNFSSGMYSDIY